MPTSPSDGRFLMLGALEVLLNQALAMHPQGAATLERLAGKVVRVRAHSPDFIFYCLVDPQGVELTPDYDGDADVRVRGSAGQLLYRALVPPGDPAEESTEDEDIRIAGDEATVAALREALATFNLWEAIRTWLREHVALPEILGLLRRHDPVWLERLQDLPQVVARVLEELQRQSETQQQLLAEVRGLRDALRAERRSDLVAITLGILFMTLAAMTAAGALPLLAGLDDSVATQSLLLGALGVALLLSRAFSRRYE